MMGLEGNSPPVDRRVIAVLEAEMHLRHIMTFSLCGGRCPACAAKIETVLDQLDYVLSGELFEDASVMEDGDFIHGAREQRFRSDWPDAMFMHDMMEDDPFGPDFETMFGMGAGPGFDDFDLGAAAGMGFGGTTFFRFHTAGPGSTHRREAPSPDDLVAHPVTHGGQVVYVVKL